jgi:Rrf2 family protein
MKLQKATMCGLYAILELAAHPDRQISAAEIASKYQISINHLAKVLRTLVRARLVESIRGAGGGYRFCGNPKRVTLLDVISLFEEVGADVSGEPEVDESESRALHTVLREIDEIAVTTLRSISITTLLKIMEKQNRRDASRETKTGPRAGVLHGD